MMGSNMQQTFVIIKPDAIERCLIGNIISRFEAKCLRITGMQMRWKTEAWCDQHYAHLTKKIYEPVTVFMAAAPIIGIVLMGPNAIETVQNMVGCTNSLAALPGTIRGDFGTNPIMYNIVHASNSPEAVTKEVALFFDSKTDQTNE